MHQLISKNVRCVQLLFQRGYQFGDEREIYIIRLLLVVRLFLQPIWFRSCGCFKTHRVSRKGETEKDEKYLEREHKKEVY